MVSDWAQAEAASADLGDERLDRRYALILSSIGNRPNLSIPAGCNGRAEMEATYRFTDNKKVTFEKILAPHSRCALARAAEHKVVVFVNDTTELDLTRPEQQVVGAGGLDGSRRRGLFAHVLHAFCGDGTPLGTASARIINRVDCTEEHKDKRKKTKVEKEKERVQKPIERKESMRWLDGVRDTRQAAAQLPDTQCIHICDSEADIYEVLAEPRDTPHGRPVDFIVRAGRERLLEVESDGQAADVKAPNTNAPHADAPGLDVPAPRYPREAVMATPPLYTAQLHIRARVAKMGLETGRRQAREAREAKLGRRKGATTQFRTGKSGPEKGTFIND
jgi:hypothetical protein